MRHQLKRLEHETDRAAAQRGALVFVQFGEFAAEQPNRARARAVQSCEQAEQRRLARPGCTDDRHTAAGIDSKIDVVENRQFACCILNLLAQTPHFNDWISFV